MGKRQRVVAEESGVSLNKVNHSKADPEIARLIDQYTERHERDLARIYAKALASCEKDIDHAEPSVRAAARREAIALIRASEKRDWGGVQPQANTAEGSFHLVELMTAWREVREVVVPQ